VSKLTLFLGRRYARLATNLAVRWPGAWRFLRGPLRFQFEQLASRWDTLRTYDRTAAYEAALAGVEPPPVRALDLGTGTGDGALVLARRFPGAEIVGVDLAAAMVEEAQRKLPPDLAGRVSFAQADASRLPFPDGSFQLVAHGNMIPFFDEVARVVAAGGWVLFAFSGGAATPIYVPQERLRAELERRGFSQFADFRAGSGEALLARKSGAG
jgi:SAM-dependent methyltransferase